MESRIQVDTDVQNHRPMSLLFVKMDLELRDVVTERSLPDEFDEVLIMARVLVAADTGGRDMAQRLLADKHQLVYADTVAIALTELRQRDFDLILISVHFNESRMLELLAQCKKVTRCAGTPIITFCTRNTPLTRTMHDSIDAASIALGAWMYLDQHDYNVKKDPDAEVRRVIERCLIGAERMKNKSRRADIQQQREELLRLRMELNSAEWTVDLEDRVAALRQKLSDVLLELSQTQEDSVVQLEKLAESNTLEDRVSRRVKVAENATDREERAIMRAESMQMAKEQVITQDEERKSRKLRHELADLRMPVDMDEVALQALAEIPENSNSAEST